MKWSKTRRMRERHAENLQQKFCVSFGIGTKRSREGHAYIDALTTVPVPRPVGGRGESASADLTRDVETS